MRDNLKTLFADRLNRYGLFLSLAFLLVGMIVFLMKVWSLSPLVPLFYNRPWGLSQLGKPIQLLSLLLLSLGVLIINIACSLKLFKEAILLPRILLWVSVLVSILATIAVLQAIFLVT